MNSEELLRQLGGGGDWQAALRIVNSELGRSSTRIIAQALGVTPRTVQRMKAGAGITSATERRSGVRHADQLTRMAASLRLRRLRAVRPGDHVAVQYAGSQDQGTRAISNFIGGNGAISAHEPWRDDVVSLVEDGRWAEAGEVIDGAVMEAYGMVLGEPLSPSDYGGDFGFLF